MILGSSSMTAAGKSRGGGRRQGREGRTGRGRGDSSQGPDDFFQHGEAAMTGRQDYSGRETRENYEKILGRKKSSLSRPQTTIKKASSGSFLHCDGEGEGEEDLSSKTTGRNVLETNHNRCFVSTSSSMFFEHDNSINIGKMAAIPISPMYCEQVKPVQWDTEFFGRGATSLPGARNEMRNESTLPGLNTSRTNKNQPRQLFSRQPTAAIYSQTPSELDVSPRSHPTGISPLLASPSPSLLDEPTKHKDSDIEPWAFKIISKYHTETTHRPQSRCTTRLRGDAKSPIGPPLHLGEMSQSKSCPEFKRTGKLASLAM
jgi:hypothetical protein